MFLLEAIADIIRNVILIVLFAAFLQMLVPQEGFGRYLNFILGLFVLVAVLNPLLPYLTEQSIDINDWQPISPSDTATTILENGRRLQQTNERLALEQYRQGLSGQIEALVTAVEGVGRAKVEVRLEDNYQGDYGAIEEVQVTLYPEQSAENKDRKINIDPVTIGIVEQPEQFDRGTNVIQRVEQSLVSTFNLSPQMLRVTMASAGGN